MNDSTFTIVKLSDVDSKIRASAIKMFIDCFPVYRRINKDKNILIDFFLSSFDFNLSYVAVADAMAVGFLAISNSKERSLKFNKTKCIELFGKFMGNITYHEMMFISGNPNLDNERDVGIDYLATNELYRGKGIATKLIEYACTALCYEECFIDVDTNNAVAKRLYEYMGFKEYAQNNSLTNRMLGFGPISRMKKQVN